MKSKDLLRITVFQGRVLHFISTVYIFDTCIYFFAFSCFKMNPVALQAYRQVLDDSLIAPCSHYLRQVIFLPSEIFTVKN